MYVEEMCNLGAHILLVLIEQKVGPAYKTSRPTPDTYFLLQSFIRLQSSQRVTPAGESSVQTHEPLGDFSPSYSKRDDLGCNSWFSGIK